ncbi:MAG: universal stress protein [Myxococcales bacterium]|nr:universal stress protein [Myxococcales bacterium]
MRRILVGLDSSPRAKDVLAAAVDLAQRTQAKLRLLRCVALPPELPANLWTLPPAQVTETFLATARREIEEAGANVPPELLDGAYAQLGVAWDAICSAAREHDADLIVIGSHGYGLLDRLLGTTAAKVVNHADRSVLVVRSPDATKRG